MYNVSHGAKQATYVQLNKVRQMQDTSKITENLSKIEFIIDHNFKYPQVSFKIAYI